MPALLDNLHSTDVPAAFASRWKAGLAVLQPTAAELTHGLELHRALTICECYGFLPTGWSRSATETHRAGPDGLSYIDFTRRINFLRTTALTQDESGRKELAAIFDQAGVHCVVLPVNDYGESLQDAVERIAAFQRFFLMMPERFFQTGDFSGVERAKVEGRTAVIYSLTGMPVFGAGDMTDPTQLLNWVEIWHAMGVRFMHLGYNRRNLFADGCCERNDGGLSELGHSLLEAMNRVGITIDLPHSSRRTLLEAAKLSCRPVIVSHAGCSAVIETPRCKSDEEIKAIASSGGYIGIYSLPHLLGPGGDLNTMLRHVEHAVRLVGADHVVIGTDSGYCQPYPEGLKPIQGSWRKRFAGGLIDRSQLAPPSEDHLFGSLAWTNRPLITVGLVKMGLSDDEIAKIHSGNLRRVLASQTSAR